MPALVAYPNATSSHLRPWARGAINTHPVRPGKGSERDCGRCHHGHAPLITLTTLAPTAMSEKHPSGSASGQTARPPKVPGSGLQRLPTLAEVLMRKTRPPLDLFCFYVRNDLGGPGDVRRRLMSSGRTPPADLPPAGECRGHARLLAGCAAAREPVQGVLQGAPPLRRTPSARRRHSGH